MTRESPLSPLRRRAAAGALLASSAAWATTTLGLGRLGLHGLLPLWTAWNLMAAGLVAVAAVGIVRRSLVTQVFARGVAFWVIALALPPWSGTGWLALRITTAALAFTALRLSAPGLDTPEARAEFAPVAYRRVFLAGAAAAVGLGVSSALGALWSLAALAASHASGAPGGVWGSALLAASCFASAVGVLRMRAWGVLLGTATAVGAIACALPVLSYVSVLGLAYVCLPGALLAAPIVASRLWPSKRPMRVADEHRFRVEGADDPRSLQGGPQEAVEDELHHGSDVGHAVRVAAR